MSKIAEPSKPVPWLPKGAVDFLERYLTKDMNVLEFGSGESTIWLAERVKVVASVETNGRWYHNLKDRVPQNVQLLLANTIVTYPNDWDFILVDGVERIECFRRNLKFLKKDGVIMLDNSERPGYHPCFELAEGLEEFEAYGPADNGWTYDNWKTTWWIKK